MFWTVIVNSNNIPIPMDIKTTVLSHLFKIGILNDRKWNGEINVYIILKSKNSVQLNSFRVWNKLTMDWWSEIIKKRKNGINILKFAIKNSISVANTCIV